MAILGESTITKLTVNTIDTQNNNTTNLGSNLKTILLNSIYPIGSIYVYSGQNRKGYCPIFDTLGGSWTEITGKFLYASDAAHPINTTGGSAKGYLLDHTHGAVGSQGISKWTTYAGTHSHQLSIEDNDTPHSTQDKNDRRRLNTTNFTEYGSITYAWTTDDIRSSKDVYIQPTGSHDHKVEISANDIKTNTNTTSVNSVLGNKITTNTSDKDNANMPPYLVVQMWKRVA